MQSLLSQGNRNSAQANAAFGVARGKNRLLALTSKLEVQYEEDGEDERRDDAAHDPLVPVHPLGHGRQDLLAFADVVVHTMQL